jgi:uncharacterized protein (TIGR02118 family)
MIKTFTFLKRKPGMSREDFFKYWKDTHGPLAARVIPGLKKYAQAHAVPGFDAEFDGIVELWWESVEDFGAYLAWKKTDGAKELLEDEVKFVDTREWNRFIGEEYMIMEE